MYLQDNPGPPGKMVIKTERYRQTDRQTEKVYLKAKCHNMQ